MILPQLTSRDNPVLKKFRLVSSGSRRAPKELVIAEGVRVLEEAESRGHPVEAMVFSVEFGSTPREKDLLNRWRKRGISIYQVSGQLFQSISTVQTPQGAAALIHVPEPSLSAAIPSSDALVLCACGIQDPGNMGTLIRTAAAAGAGLVCATKGTVSARNPKSIRSSAGAFFKLPVVEQVDIAEFKRQCELHSICIYRTDARQGVSYTEADLKSPCAIVVGNEGSGMIQEEFLQFPAVTIPMSEDTESLNVAVAGAIILFEARRQRLIF